MTLTVLNVLKLFQSTPSTVPSRTDRAASSGTQLQQPLISLIFQLVHFFFLLLFAVALRPNAGHGLFILDVSRSHTTTHHSR